MKPDLQRYIQTLILLQSQMVGIPDTKKVLEPQNTKLKPDKRLSWVEKNNNEFYFIKTQDII